MSIHDFGPSIRTDISENLMHGLRNSLDLTIWDGSQDDIMNLAWNGLYLTELRVLSSSIHQGFRKED